MARNHRHKLFSRAIFQRLLEMWFPGLTQGTLAAHLKAGRRIEVVNNHLQKDISDYLKLLRWKRNPRIFALISELREEPIPVFYPRLERWGKYKLSPYLLKSLPSASPLVPWIPFRAHQRGWKELEGLILEKRRIRGILSLFPGVSKQTDPQKPKENINEAQY